MLRSNSKKARLVINQYIMHKVLSSDYTVSNSIRLEKACDIVFNCFMEEVGKYCRYPANLEERFKYWLSGLPSCGVGDFYLRYLHTPAKDIIKNALEETDEEAEKFSDEEAEKLLSHMIFSEVLKYQFSYVF